MVFKGKTALEDTAWAYARIEPPYQQIRADGVDTYPRPRDGKTEAQVKAANDRLKVTTGQRIAQSLVQSGACLSDDDDDEVEDGDEDTFEWVNARDVYAARPTHPFITEHRQLGGSNIPLVNANPGNWLGQLSHPSGLPRGKITLGLITTDYHQRIDYYTAGERQNQIVMSNIKDASWLPSLDAIAEAYNVEIEDVKHLETAHDRADVLATARFVCAWAAGPYHVAKAFGAGPNALQTVKDEYRILASAITFPGTINSRGATVGHKKDGSRHILTLIFGDPKRQLSLYYVSQDDCQSDTKVLQAMLNDPVWKSYDTEVVYETWKQLVSIHTLARDLLRGRRSNNAAEGLSHLKIVRRRAEVKTCLAVGCEIPCYRQELGQLCVGKDWCRNISKVILDFEKDWGISPAIFGIQVPHAAPKEMECKDLVGPTECRDHFINGIVTTASYQTDQKYKADDHDSRLVQPSNLRDVAIPSLEPIYASRGSPAVAAVTAIFMSSEDFEVVERCVWALGILPSCVPLSALPTSERLLAPGPHQLIERASMLAAARPSMDKLHDAWINDDGSISVHCKDNLRLGDAARNFGRGSFISAKNADLLDAAWVINNQGRKAWGDARADELLAYIVSQLTANDNPDPVFILSHEKSYDAALRRRTEHIAAQAACTYARIKEQYPLASFNDVCAAAEARCLVLLAALKAEKVQQGMALDEGVVAAEGAAAAAAEAELVVEAEAEIGAEAAAEAAQAEADEEADSAEAVGASVPVDSTRIDRRHIFSAGKIASTAAVAAELGASLAKPLVYEGNCKLPRLPWFPKKWDDHDVLSYAREANKMPDGWCDEIRQTPPAPPSTVADCAGVTNKAYLNDAAKANRSPATLYLAWLRLHLLDQLTVCRDLGTPLLFVGATCNNKSPLQATRVPHLIHGLPADYGFSCPWPTSLSEFRPQHFNICGESWGGNKIVRTWRLPCLGANLARRTVWLIEHGETLGLHLSEKEKQQLQASIKIAISFRNEASLNKNCLTPGEQAVMARALA